MMVVGIVMTSLSPVALSGALLAGLQQGRCERELLDETETEIDASERNCSRYDAAIYGSLLAGGAMLAVGIPLLVIGGKKQPVATATVAPWVTVEGGGLGLRVDL
jgi:hypothetical protein